MGIAEGRLKKKSDPVVVLFLQCPRSEDMNALKADDDMTPAAQLPSSRKCRVWVLLRVRITLSTACGNSVRKPVRLDAMAHIFVHVMDCVVVGIELEYSEEMDNDGNDIWFKRRIYIL